MTVDVSTIDRQISELEKRRIDLDRKMKPNAQAPFDGSAMEAWSLVDKEIASLQRKRSRDLAGIEETAPASPPPPALPPVPRRISDRADASALPGWFPGNLIEASARKKIAAETLELVPAILQSIEDQIDDQHPRNGHAITLTMAHYVALISELVKLNGDMHMMGGVTDFLFRELAAKIGNLEKSAAPVADELTVLRARINRLEGELRDNPLPKYRGVWTPGSYEKNNFCTFSGSIWIASCLTTTKPGSEGSAWVLAVKRGVDGKDAR